MHQDRSQRREASRARLLRFCYREDRQFVSQGSRGIANPTEPNLRALVLFTILEHMSLPFRYSRAHREELQEARLPVPVLWRTLHSVICLHLSRFKTHDRAVLPFGHSIAYREEPQGAACCFPVEKNCSSPPAPNNFTSPTQPSLPGFVQLQTLKHTNTPFRYSLASVEEFQRAACCTSASGTCRPELCNVQAADCMRRRSHLQFVSTPQVPSRPSPPTIKASVLFLPGASTSPSPAHSLSIS